MNREALKLMAGMVGALAMSAIGSVVAARYLGPVGRGDLALVSAVSGFASVVGALGMNVAFRSLYPRGEARIPGVLVATLRNGLFASLVSMAAVALLLGNGTEHRGSVIISAGVLTYFSLTALLSLDVLKAQGNHSYSGMADLVGASVATAATVLLVAFDRMTVALALLSLALGFAVRSAAMFNAKSRREFRALPSKTEVTQISRTGRSFAGFTLGQHVALQSDILVAGFFLGREQLGLYGAAATLAMVSRVPGIALGHVVGHRAALGETSQKLRKEIVAGSGVGIVVAGVLGLVSGPLVKFLYGEEFAGAAEVLVVLMIGQAVLASYPIVARVLAGMGKPRIIAVSGYAGGVFLIVAMAIAAPRHGAVGAAVAASATYLFITAAMASMYIRKGAQ